MPRIGVPVPLNKSIQGTTWLVIDIVVLSKGLRGWNGQLTLSRNSGQSKENHPWNASRDEEGGWKISGEGAFMASGERIRSPSTYPFSLNKQVNEAVREELCDLLDGVLGKISDEPLSAKSVASAPKPVKPVPTVAPKSNGVASAPAPLVIEHAKNGKAKPMEIIEIRLSEILPFEGQPREEFTESDTNEMRDSLKQEDQKQLIVVTPYKGMPGKRWELVDGERRYRGALAAGKESLQGVVRLYKNKEEQFWDSFTMNWGRRGHTPIETSKAIAKAMAAGKTVKEIVVATGLSNCWVYQHKNLQGLHQTLQEKMRLSVPKKERIGFGIGTILSRIPDKEEQLRIWNIASREKRGGLIKLKVEELAAPILNELPAKGRKRKPSDNAERLLRILQTSETDLVFVSRAQGADLQALVSGIKSGRPSDLVRRIKASADSWKAFWQKVEALA